MLIKHWPLRTNKKANQMKSTIIWVPKIHTSSIMNCYVVSRYYLYNGPSWLWSYGSWIYNYLCNQCLSPLKLWVRTPYIARFTKYNIMWWRLSMACDRSVVFSGYSVFSTNKTDSNERVEMLLKVALNTINQTKLFMHKAMYIQ